MNIADVDAFADHIACSSTTRSELVLPVWNAKGRLLGVLDIDSARGASFKSATANAKDRNVMLSPQLLGILRAYWKLARPPAYLFPGRDEEHPINPTVLHAACRSAVKAAGLTQRVTLHSLRHSFATRLLENGTRMGPIS